MKKIFAVAVSVMMVMAMVIPASAAYVYKPVSLPSIPSFSIDLGGMGYDFSGAIDKYLKENPVDVKVPAAPVISSVRYTHAGSAFYMKSVFEVKWGSVEGADSYEVMVTKADGSTLTYTSTSTTLYKSGLGCFRVYCEETSTWESATVSVRAVSGETFGLWSDPVAIGCNSLHII